MDTTSGRVVHKRCVSKKLMFIDLESTNDHRVEAVFKLPYCTPELMFQATKTDSKIHLGDLISVEGTLVSDMEIRVTNYEIIERWADNSDIAFVPQPPLVESKKKNIGICKYWKNTGKCPLGNDCSHLHKAELPSDHQHDTSHVSRHARANVFADWLMSKFPETSHVLDVAGGKGDMAFELIVNKSVQCSVVDPRNPRKYESKHLPKWKRKLLAERTDFEFVHHETEFDEGFCRNYFTDDTNSNCLVIGMHPDQATEAIVDLCLQFKKPFAIVPCCVFAYLAPERRLKNGKEPTSYEDFCQFLIEKNINIEQDELSFKGRNVVLYWSPRFQDIT